MSQSPEGHAPNCQPLPGEGNCDTKAPLGQKRRAEQIWSCLLITYVEAVDPRQTFSGIRTGSSSEQVQPSLNNTEPTGETSDGNILRIEASVLHRRRVCILWGIIGLTFGSGTHHRVCPSLADGTCPVCGISSQVTSSGFTATATASFLFSVNDSFRYFFYGCDSEGINARDYLKGINVLIFINAN